MSVCVCVREHVRIIGNIMLTAAAAAAAAPANFYWIESNGTVRCALTAPYGRIVKSNMHVDEAEYGISPICRPYPLANGKLFVIWCANVSGCGVRHRHRMRRPGSLRAVGVRLSSSVGQLTAVTHPNQHTHTGNINYNFNMNGGFLVLHTLLPTSALLPLEH